HADHLVHTRDTLNRILAERTGKPIEQIRLDTERDNFLSAEEAKAYGLVDEVITKR
ncbi:MAG: ATP-dependent Clp protease proteolytic subunit, partial [Oscillospiraceae bacterium]|nr:ATP-dependent Clp protease proteolytic subunit [Oscillospiraceae bacterium]